MSKQSEAKEPLYDVVVIEFATRKIVIFAGIEMPLNTGTHNAERRLETALQRLINNDFDAEIVPTGQYKEGDKIP